MQKHILNKAKIGMLMSSLISMNLQAEFTLDDAFQEMSRAVGKIQKKFKKVHNSMNSGMQTVMQSAFSTKGNILDAKVNDADVLITVNMEFEKDSIKAVVHNDILNIKAHNKQSEMELIVDQKNETLKLNTQQKIEKVDQDSADQKNKKSSHVSFSSQQMMQSLPAKIMLADVVVEYEDGLLTVKLSRSEPLVSSKVINVIKK